MITLLHGSEPYLIDRASQSLLEELRSKVTLDFNFEDLQADSMTADQFAEKVGTLPFIDPCCRMHVQAQLGYLLVDEGKVWLAAFQQLSHRTWRDRKPTLLGQLSNPPGAIRLPRGIEPLDPGLFVFLS